MEVTLKMTCKDETLQKFPINGFRLEYFIAREINNDNSTTSGVGAMRAGKWTLILERDCVLGIGALHELSRNGETSRVRCHLSRTLWIEIAEQPFTEHFVVNEMHVPTHFI